MDYSATKNKPLLKRCSSSGQQKRAVVLPSSAISRTNPSPHETVSPLILSLKQNDIKRPKTTTIQTKPTLPQRNIPKALTNVPKSIPPPVAPRTVFPHQKTKMEHLPIPMERKSSNKTNVAEERMTTITTMDKSDKLILPNVHNTNQLSSDHKISATQTISQPKPYPPGLCGLINIGNTCFMNSALQCLSNIPQLTQWAQKQKPYSSTQTKDIIHVYTSLIQSMWSGENNTMNPRDIKEIVSHSAPIFTDYGQKDSHEFMNSLLNALERTHCASIITKLFHIHTQSQVTCRGCTSIDTTDETTTFLPLPLPRKTSYHEEILLENLINDYCLEDNLDGSYYCHSCTNYTQAKQKTNICSPLPHVLIIQLKRFPFDGTFQKLDTFVRYKLQYKNLISKNDIYQLCAVSSHVGSLANGHYTTLARNHLMKQWYLFNDNRIDKIKMDAVITSDAYVLVYLKSEEWDSSIS